MSIHHNFDEELTLNVPVDASEAKEQRWKEFARHETDSGSAEVQIALATGRIVQISKHLEKHKKDKHSHRGLLKLVNHRKRMLEYLQSESMSRYLHVVHALGLRARKTH